MDESIGADRTEWLVGIAYDPGLNVVRRLFHRPRTGDLLSLCHALDSVLIQNASGIQNIEWWHGEPQMGGSSAHPV